MFHKGMIKAIRIGILAFIIGLSVFTSYVVVLPLLFTSYFAALLGAIMGLLIALCVREIGRVRKE